MVSEIRKRSADSVPSGGVSVWELLRKELTDVPRERPANSVTAKEFAEKTGYTIRHAEEILKASPALVPVRYRIGDTMRSGVCFVPSDDPEAA